uniref:Late blight resistance protein homolog R1A-3 n=1 Tax=Nicotiana tabacum TaxID=4097 RepID=A0A1S3Z1K4_TOBAC|nr:PREDICTED: putative late blight resistance protein homolog R1A-3 [Nicotiana tabacum]XP_016458310.1 PREDICTED: putative late blight resistance protein homolog R1A-3 [Nicotiana tabacum]XP_016458311.1 PREDICTED: putative late blight resistance protein homolog R1A-3 [Nicotiana tabacum]
MSEIERRFLDTFLYWATQKGRIKDGRLRGHGMQVGDTVSGPRADLSSAEVKEGYEFLLSLDPGRWPLPNLCSPLFQKFIDYILQNVKDLFKKKKELNKFDLLKKEFQVLEESLKYLKTFLRFIKDASVELEKSRILFNHMEVVTRNAAYICYLCFVEEMDEDLASCLILKISNVLQEIKPIEPQVAKIYTGALRCLVKSQNQYNQDVIKLVEDSVHFLLKDHSKLLNSEACSLMLPPMKDQAESICQASKQLLTLLIYPPEDPYVDQGKLSDILTHVEGLIAEVASVAYSFSVDKAAEVNLVFSDLLKKIEVVMKDLNDRILKSPLSSKYNFPKTDGLGFIDSLLRYLKELLQNGKCDSAVKDLIAEAQEELSILRSLLEKFVKQQHAFEEVKKRDLWTKVISLAYQAERIIDCLVMGDYPVWYQHLLCKTTIEIKLVNDQLAEFHVQEVEVLIGEEAPDLVPQEVEITPGYDEVVVGFDEEAKSLIKQLVGGAKELDIVSIVGMPGLGKTTLAKKVYHDETIRHHFDVHAMCCLSQTYDRRKLLLEILNQVRGPSQQNEKDPVVALRRFLMGKRYLLYIDDVWSINAWEEFQGCFPVNENGSRILLTSRLSDVASDINPARPPLQLRFLSTEESWELLQIKLFNKPTCPSELCEVGEEIARECQGLPLLVILVAGVLTKKEKNKENWRKIAESINSDTDISEKCLDIIELSYRHLPDHLKPCLLYFASFREDEEIPISNLAWLWTIEGFIPNREKKSVELVAESLLNDLIGRSLVMVNKKRSTGGVRSCHIHDMLHDFCATKAKEEKFMQITSTENKDLTSSFYEHRRLCIHHSLYWAGRIGNLQVRSVFFKPPKSGCQEFFDLENFKLLKVLQMECPVSDSSFQRSKELILLKYLGIKGYIESMPLWIANLSNLEVLLVITVGSGTILPMAIWNMPRLKHVHVQPVASFDGRIPRKSTNLCCLETLATVSLTNKLADYMIKKATRLRKLKCHCKEPLKLKLDALPLETLSVNGKILKFSMPETLTKLTLSDVSLPQTEMSNIGRLPNLVVLKLEHRAFQEGKWDVEDEEFPSLKVLKLRSLKITEWNASDESLQNLERLLVESCFHLQEIPSAIGEISSIKMIEVKRCGESLEKSVRQIQEEQKEEYDKEIKVIIYHLDSSA